MKVQCKQCGTPFSVCPSWVARGGGQYCSRRCNAIAHTYIRDNTCAVCGSVYHPRKASHTTNCCSRRCYWKSIKGKQVFQYPYRATGESNRAWKGDQASYVSIHRWMRRRIDKPSLCQWCMALPPEDLANKDHKYSRIVSDWWWLCRKCHRQYDIAHNGTKSPTRLLRHS